MVTIAHFQEKLMQLYFPDESKAHKRSEKIRRRKQRMARRYGRTESGGDSKTPTSAPIVKHCVDIAAQDIHELEQQEEEEEEEEEQQQQQQLLLSILR